MNTDRIRLVSACLFVVAAVAVVTVTITLAQQDDHGKTTLAAGTPTATPPVPATALSIGEGRSKYLSSGGGQRVDAAVIAADAQNIEALWLTSTATCFVGSERTGTLCEGQPGPAGTSHDITGFRWGFEGFLSVPRASTLLHGLLDENHPELVLIARAPTAGHLLLGYRFDTRRDPLGDAIQMSYLWMEVDPKAAGEPIIRLAVLGGPITPLRALRGDSTIPGSVEDILAIDPSLRDE